MGIFGKKLNAAKAGNMGGGIYFRPLKLSPGNKETGEPPVYGSGRYRAKVELMKTFESKKDETKYFVCETVVVESNNPELPVGTRCSYGPMNLGKIATPGNIKSLLCAVNGLDPNGAKDSAAIEKEDWEPVYDAAVSESNPTAGLEFVVECFYRLKKDHKPSCADKALDPSFYTHHVFYPVAEEPKAAE